MNNFNKNLGKNPTLISLNDLNSLSSTNLVGVDNFKKIFETNKFSFSSRLLNYIEPEKIKGIQKTVFYSEVNTEFDKGDKVFIINGNYDSNSYIKTNKYDLDSDGYEVLDIDNGRIVLDVKYDSDKLPYTEVDESDVINIYYVSNVEELEQVSANINIDDTNNIIRNFDTDSNNVIYYDGDLNHTFENIFYPGHNLGIMINGPIDKGIHQIYGLGWIDINTNFVDAIGVFTDKKIKIINSDFGDYKKGFVYKFDVDKDKWIPSIENLPPIISKTNFRGGNMLGSFNSGVYGKSESVLEWNYPDAEWGGGFLYNSNWINGIINSLDTGSNTFVTRLKDGVPVEESVNPNNNGFGYNYILNSNVKAGVLNNGNVINSNIGSYSTNNIVKNYIEDTIPTTSFVEVNGGLFLDSNIKNSILKNSILNHTNVKNILFNDCLSINSQIESSVFKNSTYITDDVIRILSIKDYGLDDINIFMNKYQFEISKQSYDRLELGNYFYVKGLIFSKDPNPVNFFHLKFKLSTWLETFEYINNDKLSKVSLKITSFLSEENDKFYVNILFENDIDGNISFPFTKDIDSSNAFILDSNYESGLFESSDWNSGYNINYNKNIISHSNDSGNYNVLIQSDSKIKIKNIIDDFENDIVFLNSIKHEKNPSVTTDLPDTYIGLSNKRLEVFPLNNAFASIAPVNTDVYKTGDGYNRKGYIHKLKFINSKIKNGIFKRTYFKNCLLENKSYNSLDKDFGDLKNIRSLLIDESIFHKNDNFLSSATYVNCLISKNDDVFINGIIFNSIWDGGVFNKGVFKESTWIDGEFNGGMFYKNRTFDANPTEILRLKTDSRIDSKYIKGRFPNNRYSWQNGTFNGGEIIKSDWETGTFNGGRFSESKFYDGEINGGVIGNKSIDYFKTRIYQATINDTKVENAYLFAEDYEFTKIEPRGLTWSNGVFEKGVFGSRNFINVECYDSPKGIGLVNKAPDTDYIFTSSVDNSYRLDIESGSFKYNLTYNGTPRGDNHINIKSISDSLGNLIEIIYDKRSKRYSDYPGYISPKVDGFYGSTIKYDKNGGVYQTNGGNDWIITADDDLSDIYLDEDDNLYICYKTKIEKWAQDKKLLWTINNNFGNLSISGDNDFIYIGGIDNNKGYVEKWNSEGIFIWRIGPNEGLDYNNSIDCSQKIIVSDGFILINGLLTTYIGSAGTGTSSFNYKPKIYKLDKLNGNIDDGIYVCDIITSVNIPGIIPLLDYTYDDVNKDIVLVEHKSSEDYFVKVKVSDMKFDSEELIVYTFGVDNPIYTNIEYHNGFIYVKYTETTNIPATLNKLVKSEIRKIDIIDLTSIPKTVSLVSTITADNPENYQGYDNLIFNKFDVRGVGFKYSGGELLDPLMSSSSPTDGVLNEGPNIYEVSQQNDIDFEIKNIDFDVVKIKFSYSIKDTKTHNTQIANPLTPEIRIYKDGDELTMSNFSTLTSDKSPYPFGTIDEYILTDDNSLLYYGYATKWIDVEVELPSPSGANDNLISSNSKFKIEFTNLKNSDQIYLLKVSQFCIYSEEGVMKSIWNDGSFNGGQFVENGQWNDGTFNGGLFLSTYGIDDVWKLNNAFSSQFEYGWKDGKFNGGEFGNGQIENNSSWETGEFNGGVFKGKLWNDGIFTNGKFEGGIDVPILGTDNSSSYVNSIFSASGVNYELTRGVWKNGYVTAKKDRFVKNKKLFTDLRKNTNDSKVVLFEDVVFNGGTFSHENGVMKDSIWLGGTFESGTFEDSVFNPFRMYQFAIDNNCIWENGLFKGGDFYYSKWNGGLFNTGNAYGMIWNGGICNYMNAYNILWYSGIWKNGNWFGSDFEFTGLSSLIGFKQIIMNRINSEYGNDEYHLWNVFKDEPSTSTDFGESVSDDIIV